VAFGAGLTASQVAGKGGTPPTVSYLAGWHTDCSSDRTELSCACLPMPRRPTYLKKSVKLQVDKLERKCRYCKTHQNARGFDKHEAWCKKTWKIQRELMELQALHTRSTSKQLQAKGMPLISALIPAFLIETSVNNESVERPSLMPMEVEYASPELGHQEPTTTPSLHGTFIHFLKCLFLILM
jgi:hypothetical protein